MIVVGVHDDLAVDVARRAADGLDQRARRAQIAFLVGVENRDQRDLRQIEALAQQVDSDQHVEVALAQTADDLDALDRLDIGMQVAHAHAEVVIVVGQILGHLLGQAGHQDALVDRNALANLLEQIVDLGAGLAHLDLGIDKAGRANQLLDDEAADFCSS